MRIDNSSQLATYTLFDASPDGISECACCGKECLEINCPFILVKGEGMK